LTPEEYEEKYLEEIDTDGYETDPRSDGHTCGLLSNTQEARDFLNSIDPRPRLSYLLNNRMKFRESNGSPFYIWLQGKYILK